MVKASRTSDRSQFGGTKSSPMPSTSQEPAARRFAGRHLMRQDGALGVGEDHGNLRRDPREEAADARQRPAGADTHHDRIDVMIHLLPDLGPGALLMGQRIGGIAELVDVEGAGDLRRQPFGHVLVIFGMALADIGAGHAHLGAQGPQMEDLLLGHLVGDDQDQAIALLRGDEGEAEARIARGRLHQRAAGLQASIALRRLDHRQRDAVLDRAAGILVLQLQEQAAGAGIEAGDLDQGRVADHLQNVLESGHLVLTWPSRHGRRRPTIHEFACRGSDCWQQFSVIVAVKYYRQAFTYQHEACVEQTRGWSRLRGDHDGGGTEACPLEPSRTKRRRTISNDPCCARDCSRGGWESHRLPARRRSRGNARGCGSR